MADNHRTLLRATGLAMTILLEGAALASGTPATHTEFIVRELDSGKASLTGRVEISAESDRIVREVVYANAAGQSVQIERSIYEPSGLRVIDYALRNTTMGYEAFITTNGNSYHVRYRDNATDEFDDRTDEWGEDDFHPSVLDSLIRLHWAELQRGQALDFDMLIPQMGASVGMALTSIGERRVDGQALAIIQLKPRFGPLRLLLPRTEYGYSLQGEPALRQYIGPGPFPGSRDMVDIRYSMPTNVDVTEAREAAGSATR